MTGTYEGRTAAEWREASAANYRAREESWDRSDTDGFLSQWASGLTGRLNEAKAELAENDGTTETRALFNLDGTIASVHNGWGKYGEWWLLNDEAAARFGKKFFSPSKANTAEKRYNADKKRGFTTGTVRVKGYAEVAGGGTGMSGAASCYVATRPVIGELKAGNYTIVKSDNGPESWD
jgi:hypothetical protein